MNITDEQIKQAAKESNSIPYPASIESNTDKVIHNFTLGAKWMQEQLKPEWISINDRLPMGDTWCLCAIKGGVLLYACAYSVFSKKWMPYGMAQYEDRVTHWMPLPETPTS